MTQLCLLGLLNTQVLSLQFQGVSPDHSIKNKHLSTLSFSTPLPCFIFLHNTHHLMHNTPICSLSRCPLPHWSIPEGRAFGSSLISAHPALQFFAFLPKDHGPLP